MKIITLLTDFGSKDGYVGTMKGVIWGIASDVQIADITHEISPQNIMEGALILGQAAPFFPPGTIHVVVVDPGVGTDRRPIAARLGHTYFVGPDNGLCTPLLEAAEVNGESIEIVCLDQPGFWVPEPSEVFHGRDIFAPVAAHLANGIAIKQMGRKIVDPLRLIFPQPIAHGSGLLGEVVMIDRFGNLATNITSKYLAGKSCIKVHIADREIDGLVRTYGERPVGEFVALIDSSGRLSVCVVNGNAAAELNIRQGEQIEVIFQPEEPA